MIRRAVLSLCWCLAAAFLAPAAQNDAGAGAVAITAEPSHHLALENPYVRVFQVEAAPLASTLVHRHDHDYIWVAIGAAEITNALAGKAPVRALVPDGDVRWVRGGFAHRVTNEAVTPFRNVTVELLKANGKPANPEARGMEVLEGGMAHTLFQQDGVVAKDILLNPGASLPRHRHARPHLAIAVSALELKSTTPDGTARVIRQQPGEFAWVAAGVEHELTNVGKAPAHVVILEFE